MKPTIRYATEAELPDSGDDEQGNCKWTKEGTLTRQCSKASYEPCDIPEAVELPVYVCYNIGKYSYGNVSVQSHPPKIDDPDFAKIILTKLVVKTPLPKVEREQCVLGMVEALKKQREEILATAHREAMQIDNRIGDLLAITHQPSEA